MCDGSGNLLLKVVLVKMCLKKLDLKAPFKIRNAAFNADHIQNDLCRCLEGKEGGKNLFFGEKDLTECGKKHRVRGPGFRLCQEGTEPPHEWPGWLPGHLPGSSTALGLLEQLCPGHLPAPSPAMDSTKTPLK